MNQFMVITEKKVPTAECKLKLRVYGFMLHYFIFQYKGFTRQNLDFGNVKFDMYSIKYTS